jgi:hypothetical protein
MPYSEVLKTIFLHVLLAIAILTVAVALFQLRIFFLARRPHAEDPELGRNAIQPFLDGQEITEMGGSGRHYNEHVEVEVGVIVSGVFDRAEEEEGGDGGDNERDGEDVEENLWEEEEGDSEEDWEVEDSGLEVGEEMEDIGYDGDIEDNDEEVEEEDQDEE